MNGVEPFIRHMLLCEKVQLRQTGPMKVNALGLMSFFSVRRAAGFPARLPKLCVYIELSGGRGSGSVRVDVRNADSGFVVSSSPEHEVTMAQDPLEVQTLVFNLADCALPHAGLYWVQFCYNDRVLAEQPLMARVTES